MKQNENRNLISFPQSKKRFEKTMPYPSKDGELLRRTQGPSKQHPPKGGRRVRVVQPKLPNLIENYFYPECSDHCAKALHSESLVLHDVEHIEDIRDSMVTSMKESVLVQEYNKLFDQKLLKCSVSPGAPF